MTTKIDEPFQNYSVYIGHFKRILIIDESDNNNITENNPFRSLGIIRGGTKVFAASEASRNIFFRARMHNRSKFLCIPPTGITTGTEKE